MDCQIFLNLIISQITHLMVNHTTSV